MKLPYWTTGLYNLVFMFVCFVSLVVLLFEIESYVAQVGLKLPVNPRKYLEHLDHLAFTSQVLG